MLLYNIECYFINGGWAKNHYSFVFLLIVLTSLSSTNKIQKNFCFKVRLVRMISSKTKERYSYNNNISWPPWIPGRHDTCIRVLGIWNHLLKMAAVIGFSFKERFLRFQLLFPDFYHFHHVIWRMKWAKKLKTKNGQNTSSRFFPHDAAGPYIGILVLTSTLSGFKLSTLELFQIDTLTISSLVVFTSSSAWPFSTCNVTYWEIRSKEGKKKNI